MCVLLYTRRGNSEEGVRKRIICGEENASRVAATLLYFCFPKSQSHVWLLSHGTYFITIFNKKRKKKVKRKKI